MRPRTDQTTTMLANIGVQLLEQFHAYRAAGGTTKALCRELGIKPSTLWDRLTGRQNFTITTLAKTCSAMNARVGLVIRPGTARPLPHAAPTPNRPAPPAPPTPLDSVHRLAATAPLDDLRDYRGARISAGLQRRILHAVAANGPDWTGPARLAELADAHYGTTRRALQAMTAAGLIVTTTRQKRNLPKGAALQAYTVCVDRLIALAAGTHRIAS